MLLTACSVTLPLESKSHLLPFIHLKWFNPFNKTPAMSDKRIICQHPLQVNVRAPQTHGDRLSFSTSSIPPSPHPSCWRNSQPSLQVASQPRPAEHVFSSPGWVKVRSFIHSQWYSGPAHPLACLSCAAPSQQMMNSTQPIDRQRKREGWKSKRKTERDPPPMPPDASRPS